MSKAERSPEPAVEAEPDILCVGAQKAGTGWLYEQLRAHPDFWMPPVKELHYFDRLNQNKPEDASRSGIAPRKLEERIATARQHARDERDRHFLDAMEKLCARSALDLPGYGRLFSEKGSLISGDVTPGYSVLSDEMIAQIVAYFPNLKVIFVARDPVTRAWSQLSMYVRRGLIDPFDVNDAAEVRRNLRRPEVVARSYASDIVSRWRRHVSPERFRIFFFDNLKTDPVGTRSSIMTFLGGDPAKASGNLAPDHNTKSRKEKLRMSDATRSHLAKFFEQELKACAAELGGAAADWPARYGF